MYESLLSELREVRSDIKELHEEIHKVELSLSVFRVRTYTTAGFVSILVASAFSLFTAYLRG